MNDYRYENGDSHRGEANLGAQLKPKKRSKQDKRNYMGGVEMQDMGGNEDQHLLNQDETINNTHDEGLPLPQKLATSSKVLSVREALMKAENEHKRHQARAKAPRATNESGG